jgi:hypothetical protein
MDILIVQSTIPYSLAFYNPWFQMKEQFRLCVYVCVFGPLYNMEISLFETEKLNCPRRFSSEPFPINPLTLVAELLV